MLAIVLGRLTLEEAGGLELIKGWVVESHNVGKRMPTLVGVEVLIVVEQQIHHIVKLILEVVVLLLREPLVVPLRPGENDLGVQVPVQVADSEGALPWVDYVLDPVRFVVQTQFAV